MTEITGQCDCAQVQFQSAAKPLFRALCHCSICRSFHGRDFGDFLVFRMSSFRETGGDQVDYKVYQNPPLLRRGKCQTCAAPILERLSLPLFPKFMLLPSRFVAQQDALPAPSFHMFYDCRVADVEDDLPKSSGYLPSQLRFSSVLLGSLIKGRG